MNPATRFTGRSAACLALATAMGGLTGLTPLGSVGAETTAPPFVPQADSAIPDDDFGKVIRLGERIFRDTGARRGPSSATICAARTVISTGPPRPFRPLWAAYLVYRPTGRRTDT